MIAIKDLHHHPEDVIKVLERRGGGYRQAVDGILELDRRCRQLKNEAEQLRVQQKASSARTGKLRKAEGDGSPALQTLREEAIELRKRQDEISEVLGQAEDQLEAALLQLPNLLADSVPVGKDSTENVVVHTTGGLREFQFSPKAHFERELEILDLERGSRLTGSGFYVLRDQGARLKRALVNFMLDLHTGEHGYTEIQTPNLANAMTMRGTGQLPKFAEDMYQVDDGLFAIPTAEVTLTNLHAGEILREEDLPKHYTAEMRCYRKERGKLRQGHTRNAAGARVPQGRAGQDRHA
jgi:seryl-tRNA synthetase